MDGHTFISWNIPNFVSIALMAIVLMILLKLAGKYVPAQLQMAA